CAAAVCAMADFGVNASVIRIAGVTSLLIIIVLPPMCSHRRRADDSFRAVRSSRSYHGRPVPPQVVAILATYNEERFIEACLAHLAANGVEADLCDNDSTDRRVEIATSFLGRGLRGI